MPGETDPTRPEAAGSPWLPVAVLAGGAFTTVLNTTMLSPLLTPIAADLGVAAAAAGQLATVTAACAAAVALLVAPVLDRAPRRSWLRAEYALLAAATLLTALAPSFGWLVAARALAGVGGAFIFGICLAAVGDLFPDPARRNRAVGLIGTAATLGGAVGLPVLTQVEAAAGWRWAVAAYLPLIALLFAGTFALPPGAPAAPGRPPRAGRNAWAGGYRAVLADRFGLRLQAGNAALSAVWFGWLIYLGAFARADLGFGAAALSLLFLAVGAGEVVGANLAPALLRRRSAHTVGVAAALALAAGLVGVSGAPDRAWALFAFAAVASLAGAALFTVLSILILEAAPRARGAASTLMSAGFELGGMAGVGGAGAALVLFGAYPPVYRLLGLVPLAALALLALAARRPLALPRLHAQGAD